MNNLDETIKKILFNMNYDSRKVLSENAPKTRKNIITEAPKRLLCGQYTDHEIICGFNATDAAENKKKAANLNKIYGEATLGYNDKRKIPGIYQFTGSAIWDFQTFVWFYIDGNQLPVGYKYTEYSSKKCPTVLSDSFAPGRKLDCIKIPGIEVPGVIDGVLGSKTENAWKLYGNLFMNTFPKTWKDGTYDAQIQYAGIVSPITGTQAIKNYQKYFIDVCETDIKYRESEPGVVSEYLTRLCGSNGQQAWCAPSKAISGVAGPGFSAAEKYNGGKCLSDYKTKNSSYYSQKPWDWETQQSEDLQKKQLKEALDQYNKISNLPTFYRDPSGWNGINSRIENTDITGEPPKNIQAYKNWTETPITNNGWNRNPSLYPVPRQYTKEDFLTVFKQIDKKLTMSDVELYLKNKESYRALEFLVNNILEKLYFNFTPTTQQEGLSLVIDSMYDFNEKFKNQKEFINTYCPNAILKLGGISDQNEIPNSNRGLFGGLRMEKVCENAGGLWTFESGGDVTCFCRDKTAPYFKKPIVFTYTTQKGTPYKVNTTIEYLVENGLDFNLISTGKNFSDYNTRDWVDLTQKVIMGVTLIAAIVLPFAGVSAIVVESIMLSLDILDIAASVATGDPFQIGLSVVTFGFGGASFVNELVGLSAKKAFLKDFQIKIKWTNEEWVKFFPDPAVRKMEMDKFIKRADEILNRIPEVEKELLHRQWKEQAREQLIKKSEEIAENILKSGDNVKKFNKLTPIERAKRFANLINEKIIKNVGLQVVRQLFINFFGPLIAWDYIAAKSGMCNTQSMSKAITDWEKMKSNLMDLQNEGLLTIEDQMMINEQNSTTMKTMMGLASIMGWTQIWTKNCEVFNAASYFWGKVKQKPEKLKEIQDIIDKRQKPTTQNTNFIYIIEAYIKESTFNNPDEVLNFIIQCVLQDYLNHDSAYKDTTGEEINLNDSAITGNLESKTKKAIRYFKYKTNLWKFPTPTGPIDNSVLFETDIENETYTSEFLKKIIEYLKVKEKDGIQVTVLGTASENLKNAVNPKITVENIDNYLGEALLKEFGITRDFETWQTVPDNTKIEIKTIITTQFESNPDNLSKAIEEIEKSDGAVFDMIFYQETITIPEDKQCKYNQKTYGFDVDGKKLYLKNPNKKYTDSWSLESEEDTKTLTDIWKKGGAGSCTTLAKLIIVENTKINKNIFVEGDISRIKNLMGL